MKSMTGYGRGEARCGKRRFRAEVRSLNHRSIDVRIRIPRGYLPLEMEIQQIVRERFSRGSIDVVVEDTGSVPAAELSLDLQVARKSLKLLKALQRSLGLGGELGLDHLLAFRDMYLRPTEGENHEGCARAMRIACQKACDDLDTMRAREGAALHTHIEKIMKRVGKILKDCEERAPDILRETRDKMRDKVAGLIERPGVVDDKRLEQELAFIAERHDISEELERLKSHVSQVEGLVRHSGPVGVKLNFIFQEMAREAGTLAAKSGHNAISVFALDLRAEIEKVREQIQNIE